MDNVLLLLLLFTAQCNQRVLAWCLRQTAARGLPFERVKYFTANYSTNLPSFQVSVYLKSIFLKREKNFSELACKPQILLFVLMASLLLWSRHVYFFHSLHYPNFIICNSHNLCFIDQINVHSSSTNMQKYTFKHKTWVGCIKSTKKRCHKSLTAGRVSCG